MSTWIKVMIGAFCFFGVIFGYAFQANHLSTHLELGSLMKTGAIAGAILGLIDGYLFQKMGKDQDSRFSIFTGVLVIGIILGPLILSLLNRYIGSETAIEEFELISIKPVVESRFGVVEGSEFESDGHMIQFSDGDDIYEIKVTVDVDELKKDEDSILFQVAQGGLGYRYIEQIESAKPYQIAALPSCYRHHQL